MPRRPRVVLPEHPHHVVLRANNRRRLFSYPREYHRFLFLVGRGLRQGRCALHAVTLMTNHVHLIVTPRDGAALGKFVKFVAQRYAQGRNLARRGSGRLFEERYYSVPIVDERQLAVATAYVELNPVRAGMTTNVGSYRWSTYGLHVGEPGAVPHGLWTPSPWYLGLGVDAAARRERYREWVALCAERDERPESVTRDEPVEPSPGGRLLRPDGSTAA